MGPVVQCRIHKKFPINLIRSLINPNPLTDSYFFMIFSSIILPSIPTSSSKPLSSAELDGFVQSTSSEHKFQGWDFKM